MVVGLVDRQHKVVRMYSSTIKPHIGREIVGKPIVANLHIQETYPEVALQFLLIISNKVERQVRYLAEVM
jgi:hypothetical protein